MGGHRPVAHRADGPQKAGCNCAAGPGGRAGQHAGTCDGILLREPCDLRTPREEPGRRRSGRQGQQRMFCALRSRARSRLVNATALRALQPPTCASLAGSVTMESSCEASAAWAAARMDTPVTLFRTVCTCRGGWARRAGGSRGPTLARRREAARPGQSWGPCLALAPTLPSLCAALPRLESPLPWSWSAGAPTHRHYGLLFVRHHSLSPLSSAERMEGRNRAAAAGEQAEPGAAAGGAPAVAWPAERGGRSRPGAPLASPVQPGH